MLCAETKIDLNGVLAAQALHRASNGGEGVEEVVTFLTQKPGYPPNFEAFKVCLEMLSTA